MRLRLRAFFATRVFFTASQPALDEVRPCPRGWVLDDVTHPRPRIADDFPCGDHDGFPRADCGDDILLHIRVDLELWQCTLQVLGREQVEGNALSVRFL